MTSTVPAQPHLANHRQNFPALANKNYFNFGGQGTLPTSALDAINQAYTHIQQQGPFGLQIGDWIVEQIALTRKAIAQELGTNPNTITITENVTAGCNIALWGIDWQPGDHILLGDCEHPGVMATVREISRRFQVEFSLCPIMATLNEGNVVDVVASHLRNNTRLLVTSHVFWNTGQVLPIADIAKLCHNHNPKPVQVLVDGAQSVGCLPLNLSTLGADFYAFTGHKWLCGPGGVGGLYVRPEALETISPTFIGLRGIVRDRQDKFKGWKSDGRRFEVSTSACPLYMGLSSAIATHQEYGTAQERYQQICQLSNYLWQNLSQLEKVECLRTSPPESGIISFQFTNGIDHNKLVKAWEEKGFLLRTLKNPDCIRACVHYLTIPEEIDNLIEEIKTSNE